MEDVPRKELVEALRKEVKSRRNEELQAMLMDGQIGARLKEAIRIEFAVRQIGGMRDLDSSIDSVESAVADVANNTKILNKAIDKLNKSSTRLGWIMIALTVVLLVLTLVMVLK